MPKEGFIATSAISLRCTLLKEDDQRILTLFTKELGVVSLIVKKISAKDHVKRALTSTLVRGQYILSKGKSHLYHLIDGHIEDSYLPFRTDLQRLQAAGQIASALLHTQLEDKPQPRLFDLATTYLHALKDFPLPATLHLSFLLKLLRHEGLLPPLDKCHLCHTHLPTFLSQEKLCCTHCAPTKEEPVSYEDLQFLAILTHATHFAQLKELPSVPLISKIVELLHKRHF